MSQSAAITAVRRSSVRAHLVTYAMTRGNGSSSVSLSTLTLHSGQTSPEKLVHALV
jgi:hypothetical protein